MSASSSPVKRRFDEMDATPAATASGVSEPASALEQDDRVDADGGEATEDAAHGPAAGSEGPAAEKAAKLRPHQKRKLAAVNTPTEVLRLALQQCSQSGDAAGALDAFAVALGKEAAGEPLTISGYMFEMVQNLCASAGKLDDALRMHQMMVDRGLAPTESELSSLVKTCASAGDLVNGHRFLNESKALPGCRPRLRTYSPLLLAYCEARQYDAAWDLYQELLGMEHIVATETEFLAVALAAARAGWTEKVFQVLHNMMELVFSVEPGSLSVIQEIFHTLPNWTSTSQPITIGADGAVAATGTRLRSLDLSAEEFQALATQAQSLAAKTPRTQQAFAKFAAWIEANGPFDIVVDGANIGHLNQNWAFVVMDTQMKHFEAQGKKVLLLLHDKWFDSRTSRDLHRKQGALRAAQAAAEAAGGNEHKAVGAAKGEDGKGEGGSMDGEDSETESAEQKAAYIREVCTGWEARNVVYKVQPGSNDDWYWLYAAVKSGSHAGQVVSNDQMRDHHFQMLAPRHFLKWRERHQIKYRFTNSRSETRKRPGFMFPPVYSHRMHDAEDTSCWYFPLAETADQWVVAWDTTKHTAPAAATTTSTS